MRLKSEDYALRQVGPTWIVLPLAVDTVDFNGMMKLNDSGAMLWKVLEENCSVDALTDALVARYDVSGEDARKDAQAFLDKLMQIGCIEE